MSMLTEQTVPLWTADSRQASQRFARPALAVNLETDIAVVGAGIAGLSAALGLSRAGKRVVVLDDGEIGQGNTARTTAHLSNVLDDRFSSLERERGAAIARIAAAAHGAAIDFIEQVQREEGIACDFQRVDGYLMQDETTPDGFLDEEWAAARAAGLDAEKLVRTPPPFPAAPCLRFPDQARFHPLAYLLGLAESLERRGVQIFGNSRIVSVEDGSMVHLQTAAGVNILARAAVIATNTPINDRVRLHSKLAPYRTYAFAAPLGPTEIPDALFWDTRDPYHYIRLADIAGARFAVIGGEDHKTGQSDDEAAALLRLESWARGLFPLGETAWRWSGQVMETIDGLAFIGRNPGDRNVYVVTGDSGMGMTHGSLAGIILPSLIETGAHPWADAFDPARKPLGSAGTFIEEQANVAVQMLDHLTGSDVDDVAAIEPGEGAVVRQGLTKLAIYRDEAGNLHRHSATCPHLGCVVRWNRLEKVWDCPCHGSQFAATGEVLHGPSTAPLSATD